MADLETVHDTFDHTGLTGVGGGGTTIVRCRKSVDESVSSTSYADSTGLSLAVGASKVYIFEWVVFYKTNATSVGIKLALQGPSGAEVWAGTIAPFGVGGFADGAVMSTVAFSADVSTDLAIVTPATGPGNAAVMAIIKGSIETGVTAGNLKIRHASETASSTTIHEGSHGQLIEV